jgi:anti-anti-sigma regulatory factor
MAVSRSRLLEVAIRAPLLRGDLPGLERRICRLISESDPVLVICDVSALTAPDAVSIDALARLALVARRRGAAVRLRDAGPTLVELIAALGLDGVLTRC